MESTAGRWQVPFCISRRHPHTVPKTAELDAIWGGRVEMLEIPCQNRYNFGRSKKKMKPFLNLPVAPLGNLLQL
jgi:hypothetical protein